MERAKKMVLVDPRVLAEMRQAVPSQMSITQPESTVIDITLQGLEKGLQDILNSTDIPEDRKTDLYSNYLQQFLTMKKKQTEVYRRPTQVALTPSLSVQPEGHASDTLEKEIVESVPKNLQKQARLLMQRVKDSPDMGWNSKGELLLDGSPIPNSNIVDLINDMLRKRKNVSPTGWQEFARKLQGSNVPAELIRNAERLNYMRRGAVNLEQTTTPPHTPLSPQIVDDAIRGMRARRGGTPFNRSVRGRRRGRGRGYPYSPSDWIVF